MNVDNILQSLRHDVAISWQRKDIETKNCYWSPEILNAFRPFSNHSTEADGKDDDAEGRQRHDHQLNISDEDRSKGAIVESTSYETLFLLAASVVQCIREDYSSHDGLPVDETNEDSQKPESSTFVVAIPEGPMLPLSILVVHALNVAFNQGKAVLVPMDPSEGKDRNMHILKDSKPSFILAVPGKDFSKLDELIQKYENERESKTIDGLSNKVTRLINFVDLVLVARQRLLMSMPYLDDDRSVSASQMFESPDSDTVQEMISVLATKIGSLSPTNKSNRRVSEYSRQSDDSSFSNRFSHIVYTSGTTGRPKGCIASTRSLLKYIVAKNAAHDISSASTVLLASSLSFDPCLSDVLATFQARANLAIAPRGSLISELSFVLQNLQVTHVLCTPTLWSLTLLHTPRNGRVTIKDDFPYLQRVALGGEPIPKSIVQTWARSEAEKENEASDKQSCRLLATYGVTEACVYQTCGEIFRDEKDLSTQVTQALGQNVGQPLEGTKVKICKEDIQGHDLVEVRERGVHGEVILFGEQVDSCTRYLNRPDLNGKFVSQALPCERVGSKVVYYYRTGDRGYINPCDGSLSILGRILGEEGMVKINGVRVELGEIEAVLASDNGVVTDALAKIVRGSDNQNMIHAYCVFSDALWKEVEVSEKDAKEGVIINGGPLWTLLRVKCSNHLRKACIPSTIVGIRQLPLSRTGKRDRTGLPSLNSCSVLNLRHDISTPLKCYGFAGKAVFETLVQYLNLQPCQQEMLTKTVSFAVLGGDSLSAAVVCRTLYARFHRVQNSRHLGGEYGLLPEPFNTATLLRVHDLGEYVDLLDESISTMDLQNESKFESTTDPSRESPKDVQSNISTEVEDAEKASLYDGLLQATTLNQTTIAKALLDLGADPNYGHRHGNRIGNTSGRNERRAKFKTAPLHLASFQGNVELVQHLLRMNASYKSPNTNGLFPIHLAAGGSNERSQSNETEAARRLECVKLLLAAGCPLLIKDANKQSILHAAARAGHSSIIEHAISEHQSDRYVGPVPLRQFIEFQDRWFRSAVHWATLNGKVDALQVLLEKGCDPEPFKPKNRSNKQTSMITETPLEICERVHGGSVRGLAMKRLLTEAIRLKNLG